MADFDMEEILSVVKDNAGKAGDSAKKFAQDVAEKGGVLIDKLKIQYTIRSVNSKLSEAYMELGKHIYDEFSNEEIEGPIKEMCSYISSLKEEIESLQNALELMNDTVRCRNCGNENSKGSTYCNVCGTRLV